MGDSPNDDPRQHDRRPSNGTMRSPSDEQSDDTLFFSEAGETVDRSPCPDGPELGESTLPRLGDYELAERLGAGGMGIVYRARQLSADRIVAVKLIRQDPLVELGRPQLQELIDRFRTEAQAAAKLDHPNIVPVYEVGEADGRPFFSMRLVRGQSLAELLRNGPLDDRRACALLEQVARGVQHAHDNGILHRDLKPQNILLDEHRDTPCIADFGLAKLAASESALTRLGEVIGTPQYMSPEQSRDAGSVTTLSDVYSLGATLYHILTGRPPFQAATVAETLRQVLLEVPVPPRRLNSAVARDLETICLKCLEKEPRRRYPSAGELADDLQRFLEHRPITARRVGSWGTTWRWARRNPTIAGLATVAIGFVAVAVSAISVGYVTTNIERRKAEAAFRLAQGAVDNFFVQISEEVLLDQPGMQPYRRELLQGALTYYNNFLSLRGDDQSELADELAVTRFRIGVITGLLEGPEQALDHFLAAQQAQLNYYHDDPREDRAFALADSWNALGQSYHQLGQFEKAAAAYDAAIELRQVSGSLETERKLANSVMNRGLLRRAQNKPAAALQDIEDAQKIRLGIGSPDGNVRLQRDLAMGYFNWANLHVDADQINEATSRLADAIHYFDAVREAQPFNVQNQFQLALCYRNLADLEDTASDAVLKYSRALEILRPLVEGNSKVSAYRAELAAVLLNLSELAFAEGQTVRSRSLLEEARSHYERLADAGLNVQEPLRGIAASLELIRESAP